ncbi:MAG: hypothetical protein R2839_03535 [Thermomicrobiales bacterium]
MHVASAPGYDQSQGRGTSRECRPQLLSAAITAQVLPFAQALGEIEALDTRHAQIDPHFQQSLEVSHLVFARALNQIEELISSDAFRGRLSDDIESR